MSILGIIGGSGLSSLEGLEITKQKMQQTPYGQASAPLTFGELSEREIIFLPRHGNPHTIPPHKVNYRANLWALKENNVEQIIAINAVGGISGQMYPNRIVLPDQIIDYTFGRIHTFFEEGLNEVVHVDFSFPYSEDLRQKLILAANKSDINIYPNGCYGATQGPRLESAAEIAKLERDGCDLVGMTGMPEAALARELEIDYVSICMVVNWAAGKSEDIITMETIESNLEQSTEKISKLLHTYLKLKDE